MSGVKLPPDQVRQLFRNAGELKFDLSDKDFVKLKTHTEILGKIESDFQFGMSIRILSGQIGEGKTWTLSWIWQQMAAKKSPKTFVIAPQDWTLGPAPAASLVAGMFAFIVNNERGCYDEIVAASPQTKEAERVLAHLVDEEAQMVLVDGVGRMPSIQGVRSFSFKNPRHLFEMFEGLASLIESAGYDRLLILADEAEGPLLHAARRQKMELANFLRHLIDRHQADSDLGLPIQLILAGTTDIIKAWSGRVTNTRGSDPTMEALKRRLSHPLFLEPPTVSELHKIAETRIRNILGHDPFIPFASESIGKAWSESMGQLGTFLRLLRLAYQEALRQKADEISVAHIETVVAESESLDQF